MCRYNLQPCSGANPLLCFGDKLMDGYLARPVEIPKNSTCSGNEKLWLLGQKLTCPNKELVVTLHNVDRVKRFWYLKPMRAAKVQASLRICAVSPEPSLLAHISSESRGTFRQKTRSLAPLNGWACAVKFCHDGMLEDTNSLDGARV